MLVDMGKQRRVSQKIGDFRVSSLPVCPLRQLLFQDKVASYGMSFYTSIGTAVHETIQSWLLLGDYADKIFCCWKAKETGEIYGPCFKRDLPKEWGNYTVEYEEITINYRGLSGHVDLVVEILPGKFIVVDFKTTDLGGKKTKYPNWRNFFPASRSSITQISTYSTLLRKLLGLNIIAWSIIYIDRGKTITTANDFHKVTRPWTPRKHKHMLRLINEACANNEVFRELLDVIDKSDSYSKKADRLLKDLVINRPCIDEETYKEWIDYKFYQGKGGTPEQGVRNGKCIMKDACLSGNRACYNAVKGSL